jgi:hypothetical protein
MIVLQGAMRKPITGVEHLSDQDLLAEVTVAATRERDATVRLIALLAQLDARRLFLREGCSSLFTYCTQVLHLSEHAAYGRIEAARTARRFPIVLDLLADGSVTLTAVTLLAVHLTAANHREVLNEARHKSKREVEHLVARLRPQPAILATVRKLPAQKAPDDPVTPFAARSSAQKEPAPVLVPPPSRRAAIVTPLAPERYKVQFTVSRETHDKLRRAQDLLRHSIPDGDPAAIFDRALTLLLTDLAQAKLGAAERPRTSRPTAAGSRHIPAAVRRAVWKRDGGQCAFVGAHGRCTERGFLEFHHVEPYAVGGPPVVDNVALRCRAHNVWEAEQYFGDRLPLLLRETRAIPYGGVELGPDRVETGSADHSLPGDQPLLTPSQLFARYASNLCKSSDAGSKLDLREKAKHHVRYSIEKASTTLPLVPAGRVENHSKVFS